MKRFLSLVLALSLLISAVYAFPISANAAVTSGKCGDNLTWNYDKSTATLTISGKGDMYDYEYDETSPYYIYSCCTHPWYSYYDTMKSVVIEEGVTSIGGYAFYQCSSLTSVTIPNSITSIGDTAFSNCVSLSSVTIPNGVTSIGNRAFSICSSLTSVTIGDSVTSIGDGAFFHCGNLKSVTIGNSVTSIGDSAFCYCGSLTSVTIPDSVTSIGRSAFHDCNSLTYNKFGYGLYLGNENNPYVCLVKSASQGISNCIIKDGTKFIHSRAFNNCSNLTSITIPDSVTSIGDYAFNSCGSLTSVTIGDSVTSIGYCAFDYCSIITDVYYYGTEKQWNAISIDYGNSSLTSATIHYEAYCLVNGHTVVRTEVPATCTKEGTYSEACSVCNSNLSSGIIETVPHSYEKGVCTVCGVTTSGIMLGDIDSNDKITVSDAKTLISFISGKQLPTEVQTDVADFDRDGKITSKDINFLKQKIIGII